MSLTDALVILGVFGSFGFLIWSRLVKRNHPIVAKVYEMMSKPKEQIIDMQGSDWQQPSLDKRIY